MHAELDTVLWLSRLPLLQALVWLQDLLGEKVMHVLLLLSLLVLDTLDDLDGAFVQLAFQSELFLLAPLASYLTHLDLLVVAGRDACVAGRWSFLLGLRYQTRWHLDGLDARS